MSHDPDPDPGVADGVDDGVDDVEGHMFVPPDERGGGHPSGAAQPRDGRVEEPGA